MKQRYSERQRASNYRRRLISKFAQENSPCVKTCPHRRRGCHAACEEGKKYDAALEHFKTTLLPELVEAARRGGARGC